MILGRLKDKAIGLIFEAAGSLLSVALVHRLLKRLARREREREQQDAKRGGEPPHNQDSNTGR